MGLQINQYPDIATSLNPLAVFDADNWTGSAFQSEQVPMPVMEAAFTKNIINSDLAQTANRVQDFAGFTQYWKNNNQLTIESSSTPLSGASIVLGGFGTNFSSQVVNIKNSIGTHLWDIRGDGTVGHGITAQNTNLVTSYTATKRSMYHYNYTESLAGIEMLKRGDNSSGILSTFQAGTGGYAGQFTNTATGGINYGIKLNASNGSDNIALVVEAGDVSISNGGNIRLGGISGSMIGTSNSQKLGFWGSTPVVQQVLATGTGNTVDDIITALQTIGLFKQS